MGVAVCPPGQSGSPNSRPLPSLIGGYSKCFCQSRAPVSTSIAYRLSEMPASIAICLEPLLVWTLLTIRGGNKECISLGWLSNLIFHRIFKFLTFSVVRMCSPLCQLVRRGPPPSVNQFAL